MSAGQGLVEDYDIGDSPVDVAFTGTSAATAAALTPGLYSLLADQDCYIKRGASGLAATSSNFKLLANTYWFVRVKPLHVGVRDYIAAIRVSASGTLRITKHSG